MTIIGDISAQSGRILLFVTVPLLIYTVALSTVAGESNVSILALFGVTLILYPVIEFTISLTTRCDSRTFFAASPKNEYQRKVVWITGASSGLGKEMAVQFAKYGARLIISARRTNVLNALALELKEKTGAEVKVLSCDLSKLESLAAVGAEALSVYGHVDILVNNGGISQRSAAIDSDFAVDQKIMDVDFLSCAALTKSVLPAMRARKEASVVINISSVAGKIGFGLRTAYCGAKHALIGFMDALRLEEYAADTNIYVCNVCPGSVQTDVAKNALTNSADKPFGKTDVNISAGLPVDFVVDRIISASLARVDEVWIAKPKEMFALSLMQYFPALGKEVLKRKMKSVIQETLK